MEITNMKFDNKRNGFWALGSNVTEILRDGYYLMFYDVVKEEYTEIVALG